MMCNKCNIRIDVYRIGEDEYEALCPRCDLKDPLYGHLENDLINKELLLN